MSAIATEQQSLLDGPHAAGLWLLPGMGEAAPRCGEWSPSEFCDAGGHVHMRPHQCGRRECPDCWSTQWAAPRTVSVVSRLAAWRYSQDTKRLVHLVVSPPEDQVTGVESFYEARTRANELAKDHGAEGGVVVPHPYRTTDVTDRRYRDADPDTGKWLWVRNNDTPWKDQAEWSPHYHILAPASDVTPSTPDLDGGWIVKNVSSADPFTGLRDDSGYESMIGLCRYLLSHAGFVDGQSRQAVTWFGSLHGSQFNPSEELSDGAWSVIERKTEEIVGAVSDADEIDETSLEDQQECPNDGCEGTLHDIWEARDYMDQGGADHLSVKQRKRLMVAYEWATGALQPPPGLKAPTSKDQATETFTHLIETTGF